MADSHTDGKPTHEMRERHRAIMQSILAALELAAQAIADAEAEGLRLEQPAAEFDQAQQRGEHPDPSEIVRVETAQAALVQRIEKMNARIRLLSVQAAAITQTAETALFDDLTRQFIAQFNIKGGL